MATKDGPAQQRPAASLKLQKIADTIIDPHALTFPSGPYGPSINGVAFQVDGVASHKGYQYATYYDGNRRLCVARRKPPATDWEVIRFEDYHIRNNDIHNVATLGICPGDGTIHLAFDHHSNPLHYRVSAKHVADRPAKVKWEASLFGKITSQLEPGKRVDGVTYPGFFSTPQGKLQLHYRVGSAGKGDEHLCEYDPKTGAWQHLGVMISKDGAFGEIKSRCPYMNGMNYDRNGRLHMTWTWCEWGQYMSHDLLYAYSDDCGRTWFNNNGAMIGQLAKGQPISVESPGLRVWQIPWNEGLSNTNTQAVDSQGRIHVVLWEGPPGEPRQDPYKDQDSWHYYHYWRDKEGKWTRNNLPFSDRRPKLLMDRHDNAYLVFSESIDPETEAGARMHVGTATAAALWKDWTAVHTQPQTFTGEPLVDFYRWRDEGVLSIYMQEHPQTAQQPTALHVIDLKPER